MKPIILVFDDDENYSTVLEMVTYNMELEITEYARDIKESRNLIKKIESKSLKPDIAIISPLLGNNFEDGSKLAKKLREISPDIKIIAYTVDKEIEWGDYLAIKGTQDLSQSIISVLEEITKKKFKDTNG